MEGIITAMLVIGWALATAYWPQSKQETPSGRIKLYDDKYS